MELSKKQLQEMTDILRGAVEDEVRLLGVTSKEFWMLAEEQHESDRELFERADDLASKLADVTLALVTADGSLSERIGLIEAAIFRNQDTSIEEPGWSPFNKTWNSAHQRYIGEPSATQPSEPSPKRSLLRRLLSWLYSDTQSP